MDNSTPAQQSYNEASLEQHAPGFFESFKSHPASVGETYFGHLFFAMRFSSRLFIAGGAALVHAFIPALFETTASRQVCAIRDELINRHAKPTSE